MPRKELCYVVFLVLLCRAFGEYEDDIQNVFKNNTTRNDFANLLQSLIKLNEQRVNVLQKLYKLEDYGVLSEVLRSGKSKIENEKLKNLFLVVLSKKLSNVRRNVDQNKPGLLQNPDKKNIAPKESHIQQHKLNSHQGKHKHTPEATTEKTKEMSRIKENFQLVFGNVLNPMGKKNGYQDRFLIENGKPRPITPADKNDEPDRTTKYSQFSESQHHSYKYTGREESHKNREHSKNPNNYPKENKDHSRAADEINDNPLVPEEYGLDSEGPKRVKPSHKMFEENHSYKNVDVGIPEEVQDQEHRAIELAAYDGDNFDSPPNPNINDYGGDEKTKSDSDTADDKNSYSHVNLKEYSDSVLPTVSRKNLQKCLGKKAKKMCSKSCVSAYKNACRRLKCSSRSKRVLKKECKKTCDKAFKTSKYSDED